jgi:hypothetical protein
MSTADGRSRNTGRTATPSYLKLVHDTTARPAPARTGGDGGARRRIEIVPLGEPATAGPSSAIPRLAPTPLVGDRRQQWPGRENTGDPTTRLVCRTCGVPARVDVVDLRTRRLHLSCDRCYRMWQDQVRREDTVNAGVQRAR